MIVVEGVDNSGKSTLIRALKVALPAWAVQVSEGPPKFPGEQDERVARYLNEHSPWVIYDRHPCVSQLIYGQMRSHKDGIHSDLVTKFYERDPCFIYCDGGERGMKGHVFNPEVDSEEHLAAVKENYEELLYCYRKWAGEHAFISYRIGDSISRVVKVVEMLVLTGRA